MMKRINILTGLMYQTKTINKWTSTILNNKCDILYKYYCIIIYIGGWRGGSPLEKSNKI